MFSFVSNLDTNSVNNVGPSTLGYNTNNQYPKFPPMMADGRAVVSSWQPESAINDHLIKKNGIKSNWEYRRYLTDNGYKITEQNFKETCNDTGYHISPAAASTTANSPYSYASAYDNTKPSGYQDSDLKQQYLTREQLDSRKVAPVLTQEQLLNYRQ
jgi:hypothetical protein